MAASLNQVNLIGNVGKDPEIRNTAGGDVVANFSIATSETWGSGSDRKERTEWHNVVVWGKLADVVEKYVTKGTKVFVQGKLTTRKWQDKDGRDRYTTEVVLSGFNSQLVLLSSKSGGGRDEGDAPPRSERRTAAPAGAGADDDIPF
jgi:single-strand DNA-binding protein